MNKIILKIYKKTFVFVTIKLILSSVLSHIITCYSRIFLRQSLLTVLQQLIARNLDDKPKCFSRGGWGGQFKLSLFPYLNEQERARWRRKILSKYLAIFVPTCLCYSSFICKVRTDLILSFPCVYTNISTDIVNKYWFL
jgi:hypothetical protein